MTIKELKILEKKHEKHNNIYLTSFFAVMGLDSGPSP
jgi:hypothetical protein